MKEDSKPRGSAKQRRKSELLSLKIPPQEASPRLPLEAPSILHFI
jgi:hypothetical protein